MSTETIKKDEVLELTEQVKILNTKIDVMNEKLTNIEGTSTAIINNTKHLIESSEFTRTNEILSNTISDPNGFIARAGEPALCHAGEVPVNELPPLGCNAR